MSILEAIMLIKNVLLKDVKNSSFSVFRIRGKIKAPKVFSRRCIFPGVKGMLFNILFNKYIAKFEETFSHFHKIFF